MCTWGRLVYPGVFLMASRDRASVSTCTRPEELTGGRRGRGEETATVSVGGREGEVSMCDQRALEVS